ncbi:MAG: 1-deoxy-D-xylulose-5-phosphate reductoisomerase [Firmicutes bacterium]|nr:1-deoxy-D-xylulose-5-phosphate reductoisomerase [Bacillota bacterium]
MKNISILGSTGSIGTQALDVIRNSNEYNVVGLSANRNIDLIEKQALEFKPKIVCLADKEKAKILKKRLNNKDINVLAGMEGMIELAKEETTDILLTSVVGMIGLKPTLAAIESKKTIALANKETLVTAGSIVMQKAKENDVDIIPVDSEHSAIFQSLRSGRPNEVKKLILTASGGPFLNREKKYLKTVTPKDALKHPNWDMGSKISIDSATLMNKGLEVIEARWLFDMSIEKIDVVVHPQSIIHSMVEFIDGNIIAQLGNSDMRIPIQYALTHPKRLKNNLKSLDLVELGKLTFQSPDYNTFPCLNLALNSIKEGGTMPAVLNAANEVAVEYFLNHKIKIMDIPNLIEKTLNKHKNIKKPTIDDIIESDKWARSIIKSKLV